MTNELMLYYAPGACSLASHIALEESGLPFEARPVNLLQGDQRVDSFLALNPKGRIPLLLTTAGPISESPAILEYVASMAPEARLAPSNSYLAAKMRSFNCYLCATVHVAHTAILADNRQKFNRWLGITVGLAVIFLGLQAAEYYEAYVLFGLTLNSGIYGSTFFMLTGFHGFHVAMGMTMLLIQLVRSVRREHFTATDHFGFEASSWYWHFVDVVWVFLFLFVYIL